MNAQAMSLEEFYSPNKMVPFTAALGFHIFLLMWDPTVLHSAPYTAPSQPMVVTSIDHLPVVPVKPIVKPAPKPVEKKPVVKKAKKKGLSMKTKPDPVHVKPKAAPKPFTSKIAMPKFKPMEVDEPIAASPIPGAAPAARVQMTRAIVSPPKLAGKSRGVRAIDVPFQLSDRGSSIAEAGAITAIPIGEERGETASLPHMAVSHNAPLAQKNTAGFRFHPGEGSGTGELSNRDKGGLAGGYHGVIKADTYIEGSLQTGSGQGKGKVVAGKGFEIGGPVGDRKILNRRLPEYPSWAEEKGITAMVKIYFTVRADGSLRPNMRIVTSSGYTELDDLAKQALLKWKFSPTSDDSTDTAWGIITFRFTLS